MTVTTKCSSATPAKCRFHGGRFTLENNVQQARLAYASLTKRASKARVMYLSRKLRDSEDDLQIAEKLNLNGSAEEVMEKVEEYRIENSKGYANTERQITALFAHGQELTYKGENVTVLFAGKPQAFKGGEGKTDSYILLKKEDGTLEEVKISLKKSNADFVENKLSAGRVSGVMGDNWQDRLSGSLEGFRETMKEHDPERENGTLVLGYRLDLVNKKSGNAVELDITHEEAVDFYAGTSLPEAKRDSFVKDRIRKNSGVASHMLLGDEFESGQEILDKVIPIDEYVKDHPTLYLTPRAVTLRPGGKFESSRPLGLSYDWKQSETGKWEYNLNTENPLSKTSTTAKAALPEELLR